MLERVAAAQPGACHTAGTSMHAVSSLTADSSSLLCHVTIAHHSNATHAAGFSSSAILFATNLNVAATCREREFEGEW